MKIAFLNLCHCDPDIVERTARKLTAHPDFDMYIHVDAKQDITPFIERLHNCSQVYFIENREKVYWGGFHAVLATLKLMRVATEKKYDYYVLLQNLDYPLKSNQEISEFFNQYKGKQFIRGCNIGKSKDWHYQEKYKLYHTFDDDFYIHKDRHSKLRRWFHNGVKILKSIRTIGFSGTIKENGKKYDIFYGAAQWAMTDECVRYVLEFSQGHPKFHRIMKHIKFPDEEYFHTIVHNSDFKDTCIRHDEPEKKYLVNWRNLHYFEYPKEVTVFVEKDFDKLIHRKELFFRKVKTGVSDTLMDHIDQVHGDYPIKTTRDTVQKLIENKINKQEDKISVIFPIYNVEKYLRRAVDSVKNQTYKNLEIILVNDGSSDTCAKICDDLKKEDTRIKVIHKKNGGVSDARNQGLLNATGDYITFVDPDDLIHPQMYQHMMCGMKEQGAEIAICNYQIFNEGKKLPDWKVRNYSRNDFKYFNRKQGQMMYFSGTKKATEGSVVWNKLVKAELYKGIIFPVGRIQEDESITFRLLYQAKGIVYTENVYYLYMVRKNGYMNGEFKVNRFDLFLAYQERINFYECMKEFELLKYQLFLYLHMLEQYQLWIKENKTTKFLPLIKKYRKQWMICYKNNKKNLPLNLREQIECSLFCMAKELYYYLWKLLR